jgi:hypothetical protein
MALAPVTAAEAAAIAKEAYIYGFPMVDNYRILHAYFIDRSGPIFKAPWNQLVNTPRVYTPEDTTVQTPNSDTPYSMIGLDLRAEPMVLTVPRIDKERYFSIQLIDLYTHNFGYIGSRATGNEGGNFLIAGPDWTGEGPEGVTKVFHAETELLLAIYRTQLFNPADLDGVKQVQAGYQAQPLSRFLGQPPVPPARPIDFPEPLTPEEEKTSVEVFKLLNFLLRFCPTHPSEVDLMERFAMVGIGAGLRIDIDELAPDIKEALGQGIEDAWTDFSDLKKQVDAGEVGSGQMFGTREYLQNNYLYRMAGAALGIYGNSSAEAMYPLYAADADGQPLDGAHRYTLRFAPGQLPPVHAFWSLTMYELPSSLLVANPLGRYLINSSMLPQLEKDPDGGITLVIRNGSPGAEGEANWLPAPEGPFMMAMRLYWPEDEALAGQWTAPTLQRMR